MKHGLDVNPDRWPEVSRVFSEAAPLDGPARHAYLDDACRHDPALRAAVESLLGAHDEAGSFGEAPVVAPLGTVERLAPGSQLGPFRVESLLGAGGMGEVYRAYDTKLHRAVAIKVLPDSVAQDPNRLARFEEEARALAALNHPNVGAIYGLEESAGVAALVLELVEGPTLAERLASGPLPFDDVVRIARQLAEGLEAAHEQGIVHRDLKPANIKITPDANVKILDFGLAKTAGSPPGAALPPSTTGPRDATQMGAVIGTVGYMSPEQARGQAVDKRTDIWAFGCVLFEMCAHQPPFAGATISDAQAAVIEREPDWELLRAGTPANLVRLLRRSLTKDPKLRLRDIGEARIALEHDADTANAAPRSTTRRAVAITAVLATVASLAIALALLGWPSPGPSTSSSAVRFPVYPPAGALFAFNPGRSFFALSPDGLQLAFVAEPASGSARRSSVWVRAFEDIDPRPLSGTEGGVSVFWSPDSRSLAFFADGKLKRFDLPNGPAVTIGDAPSGAFTRGTWGADGAVILIDDGIGKAITSVLVRTGAKHEILPASSNGAVRVNWPWFLPDGKQFLYTARLDDGEGELRLAKLRLDDDGGELKSVQLDGATRTVLNANSNAQWIEPDVIVFAHEGVLRGQHVNVETARPLGEPFLIAERVDYFFTTSRANFSTSRTGTVAYHEGGGLAQLAWADRHGNERGTIGSLADYHQSARLSRDNTMLLTARVRPGLGTYDIWRRDLSRGTDEQLTFGRGSEITPVWVDGERSLIFAGDGLGSLPHLFRMDLATTKEEELLAAGPHQVVSDVFPNGRAVVYAERESREFKLFQLPLTPGAPPTPLLPGGRSGFGLRFSPSGRAMAYVDPAKAALYVALVSGTSEPVLAVSDFSGPLAWGPNGSEINYVSREGTMMTITVQTDPSLTVDVPKPLFNLRRSASLLAVARDGRFLLLVPHVRAGERPVVVAAAPGRSNQR